MSIIKITVKSSFYNPEKETYELKEKEYTRGKYGWLDDIALEHISDSTIEQYALDNCDVVDENDIRRNSPEEIETYLLIEEIKNRGYEVVKCQTLADTDRFEQLKKELQL